jgi:ElaB/YqjD/DUF883 family membrane-anchored ribosome-binding protein
MPPGASRPDVSAGESDKLETAKHQASELGEQTASSAGEVVDTAKGEAAAVAEEATSQAKNLLSQAGTELREQAANQQKRVASGLRSLSDELDNMANASENGGTAANLVHEAASRAGTAANWLDERDPGSLLEEVRDFARRKPGMFIAIAAGAGVLAGRLTRSLAGEGSDSKPTNGRDASRKEVLGDE